MEGRVWRGEEHVLPVVCGPEGEGREGPGEGDGARGAQGGEEAGGCGNACYVQVCFTQVDGGGGRLAVPKDDLLDLGGEAREGVEGRHCDDVDGDGDGDEDEDDGGDECSDSGKCPSV